MSHHLHVFKRPFAGEQNIKQADDETRVRCDKRSNGGVGRKMPLNRDERKLNYHPQRIKYGRLSFVR